MAKNIKIHHSSLSLVFILFLANVGLLNGRSVEFVFSGDGCECPRELPFEIGIPFIKPPLPQIPKEHGYKVELPSIQKAKVKYSLDFQIEQPKPPVPPVPIVGPELTARIDRIQVPKPDCQHYPHKTCSCGATPCSCGMTPCACGAKPCACGESPCSCGSSPCSCGFQNPMYNVPVNYLSRVNRDLSKKNISSMKNVALGVSGNTAFKKKNHVKKKQKKREISEINEHLDMLSKIDAKNLDLRIPEILQYMPEVLSPTFERGKCFGCCTGELKQDLQRLRGQECTCNLEISPVDLLPNYFEYVHGSPVSYQPRPKESVQHNKDRFVYDRLGHKYKENKGRLKLVPPIKQSEDPILGGARGYNSNMDELIKDILRSHPDFIAASDHGDGILTPSVQIQNQEAMAFLRRMIEGRLSKWFKSRSKDNFESDTSYEDNSFERSYRSSDLTKTPSDVQLETPFNDNSIESSADENQETVLKTLKGNEIHLVKFKKDGKTLQILSSQGNSDRYETN